jgi:cytochrome c-type biogenesis protein CcmH
LRLKPSRRTRCCKAQGSKPAPPPFGRLALLLVRDRLKAGDGDQEIIDFVARYGEFVLLRPCFAPHTLLLGSPRPRGSSRRF